MKLLFPMAGIVMLIVIPIYLYTIVKFGNIVQAEHPEWISRNGTLSFFYTGMPRVADPNVGLAVLGIAFSSRWRMLNSPFAAAYVRRIRFMLPLLLIIFGTMTVATMVFQP